MSWIEGQGPLVPDHGLFDLSLSMEGVAQVAAEVGVVRHQAQCPFKAVDRLIELALGLERIAQIEMIRSLVAVEVNCAAHLPPGHLVARGFEAGHAQQEQASAWRASRVRICRQSRSASAIRPVSYSRLAKARRVCIFSAAPLFRGLAAGLGER